MKKVIYSVARYGKNVSKITGVGYVSEDSLIIAAVSKNNKPYVRVFEDCVKRCHKVQGKTNEYQGVITEFYEIDFETKNNNYDTREIEVEYNIWFKYAD